MARLAGGEVNGCYGIFIPLAVATSVVFPLVLYSLV